MARWEVNWRNESCCAVYRGHLTQIQNLKHHSKTDIPEEISMKIIGSYQPSNNNTSAIPPASCWYVKLLCYIVPSRMCRTNWQRILSYPGEVGVYRQHRLRCGVLWCQITVEVASIWVVLASNFWHFDDWAHVVIEPHVIEFSRAVLIKWQQCQIDNFYDLFQAWQGRTSWPEHWF